MSHNRHNPFGKPITMQEMDALCPQLIKSMRDGTFHATRDGETKSQSPLSQFIISVASTAKPPPGFTQPRRNKQDLTIWSGEEKSAFHRPRALAFHEHDGQQHTQSVIADAKPTPKKIPLLKPGRFLSKENIRTLKNYNQKKYWFFRNRAQRRKHMIRKAAHRKRVSPTIMRVTCTE